MSIVKTKTATSEVTAQEAPMLAPEEMLEQLRALRERIPEFVQLPNTPAAEQIRRTARINLDFAREAFSTVGASSIVQNVIGNTADELHQADDEMARWLAVEGELAALLRGVSAANRVRRQRIARAALQAYNVSRELVKEEEYAYLLPHVERMKRLPKYGRRRRAVEPQPQPQPQPPQTKQS